MPQIEISVYGIQEIQAAFRDMGPTFQARLLGPALGRMARVVRIAAKSRGFVFQDRRQGLGYPEDEQPGRYRDLRQSIRSRRIVGRYGGRRFRTGRAAVFAGGSGAQQAHLVEEGHGGPRPARPHRFLRQALLNTEARQGSEFQSNLRTNFPRIAARIAKHTLTLSAQHSYARTVSRRGRRR